MTKMTPNKGKDTILLGLWAGIFLALFILNRYQRAETASSTWDGWVDWVDAPDSFVHKKTWDRTGNRLSSAREKTMKANESSLRVGSDTVSESWLAKRWPAWKTAKFIRVRQRWGGIDSLILHREDLLGESWTWQFNAPPSMDITRIPHEFWYEHPLWRSNQIRAVHRYQSRIRPLQSWEEVFALAPFDSIQRIWIPMYFKLDME